MCGKFRYVATGAPDTTLFCHCESCRKHTGAPVVALAGYRADQIHWPAGAPPRYASSAHVLRAFCTDCGTPMTWEGDGLIEILIATMDAPDAFAPRMHIHHGERLPWCEIADTLPRYRQWHDDGDAPERFAPAQLSADQQIALVKRYFAAVDAEDLKGVLATLDSNCVFSVETHGVTLTNRDDIVAMFNRLWANHKSVLHDEFRFVPDPLGARITALFGGDNREQAGSLTHKSN